MNKKTLKLIIIFCFSLICLALFSFKFWETNVHINKIELKVSYDNSIYLNFYIDNQQEKIESYYDSIDDTYYFLIPSSYKNESIYYNSIFKKIYINNKEINKKNEFVWKENEFYCIKVNKNVFNVKFVVSSEIPTIYISTKTGNTNAIDDSKENSERGNICIVDKEKNIIYSGKLKIQGRGNSTYKSFYKKPYNIKLDDEVSVFGMPKDNDWCLLANSWDYSYMNNMLAYDMAKKAGFRYTPKAEYVDVYMNGKYWGIYLFTEKIEVGENRININDLEKENKIANLGINIDNSKKFDYGNKKGFYINSPEDISGGYLLERDYRLDSNYQGHRVITDSYFETNNYGTSINIKSPNNASEEEVNYICDLISEMEDAIFSEDGYSKNNRYYTDFIDLETWAKYYMIAEIAYDLDKDVTNAYYYKDTDSVDSKIYMGIAWDYDCRFGGTEEYSSSKVLTKLFKRGWISQLCKKDDFNEAVFKYWILFFKDYLENDALKNIDTWYKMIKKSVYMDNRIWSRNIDYAVKWPNLSEDNEFTNIYDFDNEVEYFKNWIVSRTEFLDSCWNGTN